MAVQTRIKRPFFQGEHCITTDQNLIIPSIILKVYLQLKVILLTDYCRLVCWWQIKQSIHLLCITQR